MKLNIPDIGDLITLDSPWSFMLYPEARNFKLAKFFGWTNEFHGEEYWVKPEGVVAMDVIYQSCKGIAFNYPQYEAMKKAYIASNPDKVHGPFIVTLAQGTILGIDRVYIRKGARDFSSLSFFIKNGPYRGARFWAKLDEVNNMEVVSITKGERK
jgi:hypothetical protein